MTRLLLAVHNLQESARACDYLSERLSESDSIVAVAVHDAEDPNARRDAGDALNVLDVRLPGQVRTERRTGDREAEILAAAEEYEADEIVFVATTYTEDEAVSKLLQETTLPVRILPMD